MNILVFTRSAWDDTNSVGNTMTNLFNGYDKNEIANLYLRSATPQNEVCEKYYSISDFDVIKGIINWNFKPGKYFEFNETATKNVDNKKEELTYGYFRGKNSVVGHRLQELIWGLGTWKNSNIDAFLDEFKPEVIFSPCFNAIHAHKLLQYVQKRTNAKVVLFHADDYLTKQSFTGNFLERLDKSARATTILKTVELSSLNYCISDKQKEEYSKIINKNIKILYKGADFSVVKPTYHYAAGSKIRVVYIGSTLYGRWRTLALLAKAMAKINSENEIFELNIYSQYQPEAEALAAMQIRGTSQFLGSVPSTEVATLMKNADIVLHVESFERGERLKTRLSFSTKIVDCLHSGRCIMAIGGEEAASIDYLVKEDAAMVAFDEEMIEKNLRAIVKDPELLNEYSTKAWTCGVRNHQIQTIQTNLYRDFEKLLE